MSDHRPNKDTINEQLRVIANGFLAIGSSTKELQSGLQQAGFSAFVPYQRFMASFADCPGDLETHRMYLMERAKSYLMPYSPRMPPLYQSPFLDKLNNDALSSPLNLDAATAWIPRLHSDPCQQNALTLKVRNKGEYERREQAMLEQRTNQLKIETERHSSDLSARYPFGMPLRQLRFKFAEEVVRNELSGIGFELGKQKITKGGVIAFKKASSSWALAFALGDTDLFFGNFNWGQVDLLLTLRTFDCLKRTDARSGFLIRYLVLVEGLATAYLNFDSLRMLETHIKARLLLFRMIEPQLQAAIRGAD